MRPLCQVLRVAPAAYYAWRHRRQPLVVEPGWHVAVREAFADHSQRTALGRLRAQGHAVGRGRIRRVLRAHGLRAQQPRSFGPRPTPLYGPSPTACWARRPPPPPTGSGWALVTHLPRQGGGWKLAKTWPPACRGTRP